MAKTKGDSVASLDVGEKMKPTMYLSDTDADMLGPVSVGDEVELTVTAKVVSVSERTRENEDGKSEAHKSVDVEIQSLTRKASGDSFAAKAQRAGKGAKG